MDIQGEKFLVIGGAGFIGSHVVDQQLLEDVAEIRIFDNFTRGSEQKTMTEEHPYNNTKSHLLQGA
mgnify:CR=1 FL=1